MDPHTRNNDEEKGDEKEVPQKTAKQTKGQQPVYAGTENNKCIFIKKMHTFEGNGIIPTINWDKPWVEVGTEAEVEDKQKVEVGIEAEGEDEHQAQAEAQRQEKR